MNLKNHVRQRLVTILILIALIPAACGSGEGIDPAELDWRGIVKAAEGSTVRWAMWGGDERINAWVDGFVSSRVKELYGIDLRRVPMDASVFVGKLANEKSVGKESGSLDLLWINGENFLRAKNGGLLYGPFAHMLPNMAYVDPSSVELDFGTPTDGYEAAYGKAQFVFEYDSAHIASAPGSFAELLEWVKANPGRFTYPQPPDFTGSAFLRQAFYEIGGGHEQFLDTFDQDAFDEAAPKLWAYLNEIKPYLWQRGSTYPRDKAQLDSLFEKGEVDFNMSYHQGAAQGLILSGRYPETVRTSIFAGNSLSNTHYTAIPFNAPQKPGALAVSNFLLSPEAQADKNDPENWGDFTVLDLDKLSAGDRALFDAISLGDAALPLEVLNANAVPEVPSAYVEALEAGWDVHVLGMTSE